MRRSGNRYVLLGALLVACTAPAAAQSLDGVGAVAVGLRMRQLEGVKRVLMIAAHPDDEDTSLLTTLARGWGAETGYLSLTRGDGGQNAIGPELWEGLGVVRTGELDAARRLDGAQQFFTRAFDYGFSKSADEAFSNWPREELLEDVVWVIRTFRPHVIVSVWSGTPRDGHGQHQAAGIIAREAYHAAGDPARFPQQIELGVEAWAPSKYYESVRGGGRGAPPPGMLRVETGQLDPLLGRSLQQLSAASRSEHRSQEMGAAEVPGPRSTGVVLSESRVGQAEGFFAGIDTTLIGLTAGLPGAAAAETRAHLEAYRTALAAARADLGLDPAAIVPHLAAAYTSLEAADASAGEPWATELHNALATKMGVLTEALLAASGIVFDVRSDDDLLVPGQTARVRAQLWNAGTLRLEAPNVSVAAAERWPVTLVSTEGLAADGSVAPSSLATWTFDVVLPADAELSRLYYLREERDGAMYRWPAEYRIGLWGSSRGFATFSGLASFVPSLEGRRRTTRLALERAGRHVAVEPTRGQVERAALVVPSVSVRVSPAGLVWPQASGEARSISVVVRTDVEGGTQGEIAVRAPSGWVVTPPTQAYQLEEAGAERTLSFQVRPTGAPAAGEHVFSVAATDERGREHTEGYTLVDYEHIERAAMFAPAEARITVVPVAVAQGLRVGYIMGSGDSGPDAIRQMGAEVELLDEDRVREGDFAGLDAIVLGVRAYEARSDVRAASDQLLDFARAGGVVIAQYNRESLGSLPPLPLVVGEANPRVTDERAAVRILEPESPALTTPNRIGPSDFDGWVQERGLYFGEEWDDAYVPLLEMSDPGEQPLRGSLLVAPVGEGLFVYTALAFFRQWSEGVPGAYRLFANLISLDPQAWRAYDTRF